MGDNGQDTFYKLITQTRQLSNFSIAKSCVAEAPLPQGCCTYF